MTDKYTIKPADAGVLRPLAEEVARVAALPVQEEKRRPCKRLNSLEKTRPLLHICQEPWREIEGVDYVLHCEGKLARQLESQLMLAPDMVREFMLPGTRKLIRQTHDYGAKVIHHSCDSIRPVIADIAAAGADAIHPITPARKSGRDLMQTGLEVQLRQPRSSDVITFRDAALGKPPIPGASGTAP